MSSDCAPVLSSCRSIQSITRRSTKGTIGWSSLGTRYSWWEMEDWAGLLVSNDTVLGLWQNVNMFSNFYPQGVQPISEAIINGRIYSVLLINFIRKVEYEIHTI
jgi:hypothetical protein